MAPPPLAHIVHPPNSASQSSGAAIARPRLLTPTTNPIPLLNTPSAQLYSLIHTALIPAIYLIRSSALVADPLRTLTLDILPIATLQAVFCVLCIPSYGSWVSESPGAASSSSNNTNSSGGSNTPLNTPSKSTTSSNTNSLTRRKGRQALSSHQTSSDTTLKTYTARLQPALLSLLLTLLLPPIPLQILLHALGAPFLPASLLPHTLALATHISLLCFYPLFYAHGVSGPAWRDICAAWAPFDDSGVWGAAVGGVVGGWLGAVPIALDWDREWQEWPVTVVWGVVGGWSVGRLISGRGMGGLGRYRGRVDLSEREYLVVEDEEESGVVGGGVVDGDGAEGKKKK